MLAIILAGGFGTRLQCVFPDKPKPMATINGRPFLAHQIDYLIKQGITEVCLCVHHMKEQIIDYFASKYKGIKIYYSIEKELLGTGGAIKKAINEIKPQDDFFALNGDCYSNVDLKKLMKFHKEKNAHISFALKEMDNCYRYGKIKCDSNSRIISFLEVGDERAGFINVGVYVMNPNIFLEYDLDNFSFEKHFMQLECNNIYAYGMTYDGAFIDIGIPQDYIKSQSIIRDYSRDTV